MKVTLNRAELLSEAQKCVLVVERKTSIPILANFLLQAKGNTLTISGTDLDRSIVQVVSAKVEAEGSVTVPARKFLDIVKKVADAEITVKELPNHWVGITAGPLFVKLVGMASTNFPTLDSFPAGDTISVPADVLTGLIARTNHAISKEESRYTLNAALIVVQPDSIRMVATDGHRLALVKHAGTFAVKGEFRTLVHEAALDVLVKLAIKGAPVEIARDDSTLFMRSNNWTFRSRVPTGQFPNYDAVIPKDNGNEALCVAADLKATIMRVAMFADERSRAIRFDLSPEKGLIVRASSTEAGEASERVQQAAYKGNPMSIGFNAHFVLDVLSKLDKTDAIRITTRDAQSSAMFMPFDDGAFMTQNVVMPMRI